MLQSTSSSKELLNTVINSQGTVLNSWRAVTSDITSADVQSTTWSHSWVQGQLFIQSKLVVYGFAHFSAEKAQNLQSSLNYAPFYFSKPDIRRCMGEI